MNLFGIVAVSGKPGLFKVIGQNKGGFILEGLNEAKSKTVINGNAKVAALQEITVYSNESEDLKLADVLAEIKKDISNFPTTEASEKDMRAYFTKVAPTHDQSKVYLSDIKKIFSWVRILSVLPLWNEETAK